MKIRFHRRQEQAPSHDGRPEQVDDSCSEAGDNEAEEDSSSNIRSDSGEDRSSSRSGQTELRIAKRETSAVTGLRMLLFVILFASNVVVAIFTYKYTRESETNKFEETFHDDAVKVLESLGSSLDKALAGVHAYVITMLSYARDNGQTWPYVTIPDFEARSQEFLALTKAVVFMECLLVTPETRLGWEAYTAEHGRAWAQKSIDYLKRNNLFQDVYKARNITDPVYLDFIHDYSAWGVENPQGLPYDNSGPFLPMWQSAPLIPTSPVYNWDLASVVDNESVMASIETHKISLSKAYHIAEPGDHSLDEENEAWADYFSNFLKTGENPMEPLSDFYYPMILDLIDDRSTRHDPNYDPSQHQVAGIMSQSVYWRDMIKNILPHGSDGYLAVFESPCNPTFTYEINGPTVRYMGVGDVHEPKYSDMVVSSLMQDLFQYDDGGRKYEYVPLEQDLCPWMIKVYPSKKMEDVHRTNNPYIYTAATVSIFLFVSAVFVFYDFYVERRQGIVMRSAVQSNKIVSSLFPATVRDRLLDQQEEKRVAMGFMKAQKDVSKESSTIPIADLFPECSVLFADFAGFTAWSSEREPRQVFTLLESIYGAFDKIAKRKGVFKVETVGDCYVAVTGLPTPRKHHASVMVKFAADCRDTMNALTKELELTLGPGTGDLQLRCGVNSGPVTAGVLRGEKGRFQLFGDTVNTASRMESNGIPSRIQVSQSTFEALVEEGKQDWLVKREDFIDAKGKGKMQTYWAEPHMGGCTESSNSYSTGYGPETTKVDDEELHHIETEEDKRRRRLECWNVTMFEGLLKKLVAHRMVTGRNKDEEPASFSFKGQGICPRDEIVETIAMPAFKSFDQMNAATVELDVKVVEQLHKFMSVLAYTYRQNPFHGFEHASHVAMSAKKLLHQILPINSEYTQYEIYQKTWGVALDPLVHLAIIFSALIHDADHQGVPNSVLNKIDPALGHSYNNKSTAEQNSIDIGWSILMQPSFADLRACMFANQEDLDRFRQVVVNSVIATDIFDPELRAMRDRRWEAAFANSTSPNDDNDDPEIFNARATIMIEVMVQASDVSHCLQHWMIYQKWNRCLFDEMYAAYRDGRVDKDPTDGWYKGELWLFDNYVIPLAKKLADSNVLGASGFEFLSMAKGNRREWELKGESIVEEFKIAAAAATTTTTTTATTALS